MTKRSSIRSFAAAAAFLFSLHVSAAFQAPAAFRSVTIEYQRTGLPRWSIEAQPNGAATYTEFASQGAPMAQPIHIDASAVKRLMDTVDHVRDGKCETKAKHLADMGRKTFTYQLTGEGATTVSCGFNFSDDQTLNATADAMLAIAETLQAGERLAQKRRFDRLGLDAELDTLAADVKNGRAVDVVNIAPVLQSITDDERVMERARRKAARLLQDTEGSEAATPESAR